MDRLLSTLIHCFADDSWPVRDTACVASGSFVRAFPAECAASKDELLRLFLGNLQDPIASVRQGAALAVANAVVAYPDELLPQVVEKVKAGLKGVKDQPEESARYVDLSKSGADFGVVKRLRDNDAELHENQVRRFD